MTDKELNKNFIFVEQRVGDDYLKVGINIDEKQEVVEDLEFIDAVTQINKFQEEYGISEVSYTLINEDSGKRIVERITKI